MGAAALGVLLIAVPFAIAANSGHATTVRTQPQAQATDPGSSALPTASAAVSAGGSAVGSPSSPAAVNATDGAAGQGATAASSGTGASPPTSAAAAVAQLAAAHPGRHMCYRAYVTHVGWQAPVCDGIAAGEVGKNAPIEAVEVSTSGTSGNEANAYMADGGWQNGGWKAAANGQSLVIGSPGSGVGMKAFIAKVHSGTIYAHLHVLGHRLADHPVRQ